MLPDQCGSVAWALSRKVKVRRFDGLIPGQDTCFGFRFSSYLGVYERQLIGVSHIDVSLPFSLPAPFTNN